MFPPFQALEELYPGAIIWCNTRSRELEIAALGVGEAYDGRRAREPKPHLIVDVDYNEQLISVVRLCAGTPADTRRWSRIDSAPSITWSVPEAWIWVAAPARIPIVLNNSRVMHPHQQPYYSSVPVSTTNLQNYRIRRHMYLAAQQPQPSGTTLAPQPVIVPPGFTQQNPNFPGTWRNPQTVNAPDSNITFRSSDGVLFRVHRKNLEVCAEGFPPSGFDTNGEVVDLTETSTTLDLLFQFMYPQRHPSLDATPFEVLFPLAEAAEKYQVFPAMNICHIRLRDMVEEHPAEISVYAVKHDYPYLVSEVAPMMLKMSPVQVMEILPPHMLLPWTKYVVEWQKILEEAVAFHSKVHSCCSQIQDQKLHVLSRLALGPQTLLDLGTVFDRVMNSCCRRELARWKVRIEEDVARKAPKFTQFL
uniref:BTB domain-containing protein n=1 Tax=Mycena chlorophos TaxID=658473 RepID=A0ABQ0LD04_MYCCL|nr:predicted protein [Mycena chlorophos]